MKAREKAPSDRPLERLLREVFQRLRTQHGPQDWWPGAGPFEIAVGAVLTQRVAWRNAERAVAALAERGWLDPRTLGDRPLEALAEVIRPALFYNQKARRLRALSRLLMERYSGRIEALLEPSGERGGEDPRTVLLELPGIGPETADVILLYAGEIPCFVVDVCARRVFQRLGAIIGNEPYDRLRARFMARMTPSVERDREYHALLVAHGRMVCTPSAPRCAACSLAPLCATAGADQEAASAGAGSAQAIRSASASSCRGGTSTP
jgi:endonuclease-3 related protein